MVTTANPATRIRRQRGGRPHPEPVPRLGRTRVLDRERVGQFYAGHSRDAISLPEFSGIGELQLQWRAQRFRQHDHPVLAALSLANDDQRPVEVDILGPQPQAFLQAHARSVQSARDHAVGAVDRGQQARDLLARQYRGHTHPGLRTAQVLHPRQLLAQDLPIEEQQRAQGLLVSRDRHVPFIGQVGEKLLHLALPEFTRVAHAVIADEGPRPVDIRLFGAKAVVQVPDALAQTCEQPGRSRAAARSRRGLRRLRADSGAHGAHISTQHPLFAHRPAVLLVTCRRTMQNGLSLGWRASFAGRLFVASKVESARRP